jgi:hypothetical protein
MLAAQMLMGSKQQHITKSSKGAVKHEVNFFNRTGPIKIMNNNGGGKKP